MPHLGKSKASDEYYTPPEAAALIERYLPKGKTIYEAAYGMGHLANYLRECGYTVVGDPEWDYLTTDFSDYDIAVTNPPYSLKNEFLQRAYQLGKPFAFLMPADTAVGLQRFPLFERYGVELLIPSRRVNYIIDGSKRGSSNFNSFWFCWGVLPRPIVFREMERRHFPGKACLKHAY